MEGHPPQLIAFEQVMLDRGLGDEVLDGLRSAMRYERVWLRFDSRWSLANLEKGLDAEHRIETKVRAVPRERSPVVLDRIADNVRPVGEWGPEVPVRGCLVLLEPFEGRRDYEARDGTPVVVHDEKSLRDALRAEALKGGSAEGRLARRVWALGRVEE